MKIGRNDLADFIVAAIGGTPFRIAAMQQISGGSKWRTWKIENAPVGAPQRVFAKIGDVQALSVFDAERHGLELLRSADAGLCIPSVLGCGLVGDEAVLILQWIDIEPLDAHSSAALGKALARLHRHCVEMFGLDRDNFIGATPQINTRGSGWVTFWQHQRLHYQLRLAAHNGYPSRLIGRGERLAADCGAFFTSHHPSASLLHGDIWAGNAAADAAGAPVIFDPATYYGDREVDVAMTELFGGYPADFYDAYRNSWPLDEGYRVRKHFYNLYHILNHANLFAGAYVRQAEVMVDTLLAEI